MARYVCRALNPSNHAVEIAQLYRLLPRAPDYLAHSEQMFEGMLLHGAQLFPGLRWLAVLDNGSPVALFPLVDVEERLGPVVVHALYAPSRFDVLYLDAQVAEGVDVGGLIRAILARPINGGGQQSDVLRLRDLREGSPLRKRLLDAGYAPSRSEGGASYLMTDGEVAPASSTRNLKSQIKRAERRLGEIGSVQMQVATENLHEPLNRFLEIENSGYKAQLNSLVNEVGDRQVLSEALRHGAQNGGAAVAELWVAGSLAASQICLQVGSTMFVLKIAFNEFMRDGSPGVVLMARFLEYCQRDNRISKVDFCVQQAWHTRWHCEVDGTLAYTFPNSGTLIGLALKSKRAIWPRHA